MWLLTKDAIVGGTVQGHEAQPRHLTCVLAAGRRRHSTMGSANLHFDEPSRIGGSGNSGSGSGNNRAAAPRHRDFGMHFICDSLSGPVPTSSCRCASRNGDVVMQKGNIEESSVTQPAFGRDWSLAQTTFACVPTLA